MVRSGPVEERGLCTLCRDINDTRAELVFQLAITNDHVEDLKATLKVLLEKHGFQFRMDIATVGSRSYALVHVWKE